MMLLIAGFMIIRNAPPYDEILLYLFIELVILHLKKMTAPMPHSDFSSADLVYFHKQDWNRQSCTVGRKSRIIVQS